MSLRGRVVCLAALLVTVSSCSSSSSDGGGGGGGAVASTPLKGTFRGAPFVAKSAHATRTGPGIKTVEIIEADVDCTKAKDEKHGVLVIATWQTGYTRDFNGDGTALANAVLYYEEGGAPKNETIGAGRVELVESAPEKNSKGRIRVRVIGPDTNIEGEIGFEVCD